MPVTTRGDRKTLRIPRKQYTNFICLGVSRTEQAAKD